MKNASATKIYGYLAVNREKLNLASDKQPKIFVTEQFSLADCKYLTRLAGLVIKDLGLTTPAMLQIKNCGLPYLIFGDLLVKDEKAKISGVDFVDGEAVVVDLENKQVSMASGNDLSKKMENNSYMPASLLESCWCFINHPEQVARLSDVAGIVIRSEDFLTTNQPTSAALCSYLAGEKAAIAEFAAHHQEDYEIVFKQSADRPIMIRLLDSALSELFPDSLFLQEKNVQLGNRGCRLAFTYPEIYQAQVRAIFQATLRTGYHGVIHIAVPMVSYQEELKRVKLLVEQVYRDCGAGINWKFGFTLETPRAILVLNQLLDQADFINLGFNDLTQLMCGFSRDDASRFLPVYIRQGVLPRDPFVYPDEVIWNFLQRALNQFALNKDIFVPIHSQEHYGWWKKKLTGFKHVTYLCQAASYLNKK